MDPSQVSRDADGIFRCRECGFRYALDRLEVARTCGAAVVEVRAAAEAIPTATRARRPSPSVWSPNAYCAHLGDAAELIEQRVRRIATENRPLLSGYDQGAAAEAGRFDEVDMDVSLARLDAAVTRFVDILTSLSETDWSRLGVHEEAGELRLGDIAQDMPHELTHHAGDLRRLRVDLGA